MEKRSVVFAWTVPIQVLKLPLYKALLKGNAKFEAEESITAQKCVL